MDHGANFSFSMTCVKGTCRQNFLSHRFIYLLTNFKALRITLSLSSYLCRITEAGLGILTMFGFRYFVRDWTMDLARIVCAVPRLIIATIIILFICAFFLLSIIIGVVTSAFLTLIGVWIPIVILLVVAFGILSTSTWSLFATMDTSQDFFFL